MSRHKYDQAIADFNAALQIDPNDAKLLQERRKAASEKRFG